MRPQMIMGHIYAGWRRHEMAKKYYLSAVELASERDDPALLAVAAGAARDAALLLDEPVIEIALALGARTEIEERSGPQAESVEGTRSLQIFEKPGEEDQGDVAKSIDAVLSPLQQLISGPPEPLRKSRTRKRAREKSRLIDIDLGDI